MCMDRWMWEWIGDRWMSKWRSSMWDWGGNDGMFLR